MARGRSQVGSTAAYRAGFDALAGNRVAATRRRGARILNMFRNRNTGGSRGGGGTGG